MSADGRGRLYNSKDGRGKKRWVQKLLRKEEVLGWGALRTCGCENGQRGKITDTTLRGKTITREGRATQQEGKRESQ